MTKTASQTTKPRPYDAAAISSALNFKLTTTTRPLVGDAPPPNAVHYDGLSVSKPLPLTKPYFGQFTAEPENEPKKPSKLGNALRKLLRRHGRQGTAEGNGFDVWDLFHVMLGLSVLLSAMIGVNSVAEFLEHVHKLNTLEESGLAASVLLVARGVMRWVVAVCLMSFAAISVVLRLFSS